MFDIGMTELLVIGIVALIVVGPKDLPGMFRTLGRFTGKMRSMAREFQRAMNDAADESGVGDIGKDLKGLANPKKLGLDRLNEAADKFEKWEPGSAKSGQGDKLDPDKMGPETAKLAAAQAERKQSTKDFVAGLAKKREAEAAAPIKDTGTAADTALTKTDTET